MPYLGDPNSGLVFVLVIFLLAIFATLFPEKKDK